jgi:hypothetical protein
MAVVLVQTQGSKGKSVVAVVVVAVKKVLARFLTLVVQAYQAKAITVAAVVRN